MPAAYGHAKMAKATAIVVMPGPKTSLAMRNKAAKTYEEASITHTVLCLVLSREWGNGLWGLLLGII